MKRSRLTGLQAIQQLLPQLSRRELLVVQVTVTKLLGSRAPEEAA